jgi:hypothetical protein
MIKLDRACAGERLTGTRDLSVHAMVTYSPLGYIFSSQNRGADQDHYSIIT